MMKKYVLILGLITMVLLNSCEKVIEVDLGEAETQYVIEAELASGYQNFKVKVSKTADYFGNETPEGVSNATVTLRNETNSWALKEEEPGIYITQVGAIPGETYFLEVSVSGLLFEASSFMPNKVKLLQVEPTFEESNPQFEEGFVGNYIFQDTEGEENYYRFLYLLDDELQLNPNDLTVTDDYIFDGSLVRRPLFQVRFNKGQEVDFVLRHFDKQSYDYFSTLSDIVGGGGTAAQSVAAPGNPTSNWSGNALGYFSAFTDDTLKVKMPLN